MDKFITISTDLDAWGNTDAAPDFDVDDEVEQIQMAAEANGIEVFIDVRPQVFYDDEGNERDEIEWFSRWCIEGWQWTDTQWRQWFAKQINSDKEQVQ